MAADPRFRWKLSARPKSANCACGSGCVHPRRLSAPFRSMNNGSTDRLEASLPDAVRQAARVAEVAAARNLPTLAPGLAGKMSLKSLSKPAALPMTSMPSPPLRSEERRVGKERHTQWEKIQEKK